VKLLWGISGRAAWLTARSGTTAHVDVTLRRNRRAVPARRSCWWCNRASTLHRVVVIALHHGREKERAMKRMNPMKKKKLALSMETLALICGGTEIIVADSGSLSCTGPDCTGGGRTWPLSDICGGIKPR
jgi:hypothetical protein